MSFPENIVVVKKRALTLDTECYHSFYKKEAKPSQLLFLFLDDGVRSRARKMEGWRGSNGQRKPSQVN